MVDETLYESEEAVTPEGQEAVEDLPPPHLPLYGHSLGVFSPTNPIRLAFQVVVEHSWFDNFILVCIFASSILLAAEEPGLDSESTLGTTLYICNIIFTTVFTVEMTLKIISYGLVRGQCVAVSHCERQHLQRLTVSSL
jgi:ion transport protein